MANNERVNRLILACARIAALAGLGTAAYFMLRHGAGGAPSPCGSGGVCAGCPALGSCGAIPAKTEMMERSPKENVILQFGKLTAMPEGSLIRENVDVRRE